VFSKGQGSDKGRKGGGAFQYKFSSGREKKKKKEAKKARATIICLGNKRKKNPAREDPTSLVRKRTRASREGRWRRTTTTTAHFLDKTKRSKAHLVLCKMEGEERVKKKKMPSLFAGGKGKREEQQRKGTRLQGGKERAGVNSSDR